MVSSKESSKQDKADEKQTSNAYTHSFKESAAEIFKQFSNNMKSPHFDKETIMNNHRKNLEALSEVNKMATEVLKNVAQLQTQYVKQSFENMNSFMKEMSSVAQPNSDHIKNNTKI